MSQEAAVLDNNVHCAPRRRRANPGCCCCQFGWGEKEPEPEMTVGDLGGGGALGREVELEGVTVDAPPSYHQSVGKEEAGQRNAAEAVQQPPPIDKAK